MEQHGKLPLSGIKVVELATVGSATFFIAAGLAIPQGAQGNMAATTAEGKGNRFIAEDARRVYELYYEGEFRIDRLRAHQILAINRGETEKVLNGLIKSLQRD